jgi:uncharacterized protein
MTQKNIPVKELNASLSSLAQVDLKSAQLLHGKGFLKLMELPRIVDEITKRSLSEDFPDQGLNWELDKWFDELPGGSQEYRIQLTLDLFYPLECQRCLQPFLDQLHIVSQFVMKDTIEEVENFPLDNDEEDALLTSHQFQLLELIEDEILLNLPLIPKHPPEVCESKMIFVPGVIGGGEENISDEAENTPKNPFASLKNLKFDA